jgi:LCP family protein required for cell wall assembly
MASLKRYCKTLFVLIFMALSGCNLPGLFTTSGPAVSSINGPVLVVAAADSTATPTPFQPLPPTPTWLPTMTALPPTSPPPTPTPLPRTWADFLPPSVPSSIAIPPPVGRLPEPDGQVNILLLGSDQRQGEGGFRTDTILLLSLNPKLGTASLTSFPRDLYVYIPGWTTQRINTAQAHGGFETTSMTFEYNFGVRPDHFVMINFWSFVQVIDNLGGVDVQVAVGLSDHRDGYGNYYVPPGTNHMDGETALWYVRSRYSTSDFERTRRQQEVLQATFVKLLSLNGIKQAPDLYKIYKDSVTTDLKFSDLAYLLPLATKMSDTSLIEHYLIGRQQVTGWVTPTGAQVLLPNREAILPIIKQAINSP